MSTPALGLCPTSLLRLTLPSFGRGSVDVMSSPLPAAHTTVTPSAASRSLMTVKMSTGLYSPGEPYELLTTLMGAQPPATSGRGANAPHGLAWCSSTQLRLEAAFKAKMPRPAPRP